MTTGEKVVKKLPSHLASYRNTLDQTFSKDLLKPEDWQRLFIDVLIDTSQLYLVYVLLMKAALSLDSISKRTKHRIRKSNANREITLRKRFKERLESSSHWIYFEPENAFSENTGLRTKEDYINAFSLHLPEIYEETFRVEECAKGFIENHSSSLLAQMMVGMEHLGRNHISFVQQPLQWASNDISWKDSFL